MNQTNSKKKTLRVKCPKCQKEFSYYQSDFRPFCTERCKMVDLGNWMQGQYAVPAKNITTEEMDNLARALENDEKNTNE